MITVEWPNGRRGRAIILDEPSATPVSGIIECPSCGCRAFLHCAQSEALTDEIEDFILTHHCKSRGLGKEALVRQLALEHKKHKTTAEPGD